MGDPMCKDVGEILVVLARIEERQKATHEDVVGINKRLDTLNGRVYSLEKNKADKSDLSALSSRVWKLALWIAGGGTVAGIGVKEIFF